MYTLLSDIHSTLKSINLLTNAVLVYIHVCTYCKVIIVYNLLIPR